MVSHLSDAVDCLYDTYRHHTDQLVNFGFTLPEAFWIHFTSLSFMPWSSHTQKPIPLSHIIKFYTHVYRDEINADSSKPKSFTRCMLKSKFDLAYALAKKSRKDTSIYESALDIGRCALPHIDDTYKHAVAGLFIINAIPVSQRFERILPLGRLVCDIDNYTTIPSLCTT